MATPPATPGPPTVPVSPPGLPFFGHALAFRRDPIGFLMRSADYPGEVVRYRQGPVDVYLLKHPDLIKEVLITHQHDYVKGLGIQWAKLFLGEGLLTSEGEFHTRQRRLAQPAFHRQRISGYGTDMVEIAVRMREGWREGQVLDFDHQMMRLTLAVAADALRHRSRRCRRADPRGPGDHRRPVPEVCPAVRPHHPAPAPPQQPPVRARGDRAGRNRLPHDRGAAA